jgi:hypothetical protein
MVRSLRSGLKSICVFALLSLAASAAPPPLAAQTQEPPWQLIDPPPSGEVSSQGTGGVTGEADTVYVLNGPAGVAASPLPQEYKDALVPPTEPGTINVNSEEEEEVFFVGKEILEGIIASEAAGELTPEIAAIAEPLDEGTSSSTYSGGGSVNSVTANSWFNCATHEKTYNKPINLNDLTWDPDPIDLGGGFTGTIKLEGDLEGQANLVLKFNVKRKKVGFNCVPWSASFKTARISGNATSETGVTLTGSVNYKKDFGPWNLAKPHLFTVTFSVGWIPVSIGFNLPVTAGLNLDATVTGTVNYNGTHTATGTFDYTCTLKDCIGTSNFSNVGENGATQTITGGVDGRIKATPWVDVGLRAYLYTEYIAYAQVGVRPHLLGDLWGYTGNSCGDAAADGHFETARALTFDLDTRIDWTAQASAFGSDPWKKTLKTGSVNHFRFWDVLGNSTAMEPHFHGPGTLYVGDNGDYKVRMRPCWPYTDNVTYQINWGDGATPQEVQGAPATELTVPHTWSEAGNKAASVTAVSDAHGRDIDKSTARTIEVKAITPLGLTVTQAPASSTYGVAINLTATATGGHEPTIQYTMGRRLIGTTTWLPTPLVWQAGKVLSWTPAPADVGSWELAIAVKDKTTAPDANGLGYAAAAIAGTVQVVAPLVLSCPAVTQRTVTYGTTVTWSGISSTGGTPGTIEYTHARQLTGNASNPWLPNPVVYQANTAFSWTPTASDLGTWQFFAVTKDVNTPVDPGFSSTCNMGQIVVVSPLTVSVTPSPATSIHGNTITWTATANGGTPATTKFAFFRRKAGVTAWTPDVTQAVWQTTPYTWTPGATDVGDWEIIVWVKDGNTPANANTYGYASYANAGPVKIVTPPLTLSVTVSPAQVVHGNPVTMTATATGGTPSTTRFAFFRRKAGNVAWTPDASAAIWQTGNTSTWTPTSAEVGTWETYVWVKDGDTPATMNTYGYAVGRSAGNVTVTKTPLTITGTASPSASYSGVTLNWTVTPTGGDAATRQYALFRLRDGTSTWIPDVNAPAWQSSSTLSWTPTAADVGTWQIVIWAKDGDTTATQNGYGYATYSNAGPVQVVAPLTLSVTATPASRPHDDTRLVTWTATAGGGVPGTYQYAFFRRRAGTTTWTPSVSSPLWQTSNTFSWDPGATDVGTWDIYVWAKDSATRSTMNTYGYAAGANPGPITVTAPLCLSSTASPAYATTGTAINWTATPCGGYPQTTEVALLRRRAGTTTWSAPIWQASTTLSWTPAPADVGTWEVILWVRDDDTPASPGYGATYNPGNVQVVAPLGLSVSVNPTQVVHGNPVTVTATAVGGVPASTRYAFFRRRSGTTPWTPDATTPVWQTSNTFTWTPASADLGTWDIYVWVKDGNTPANQNTYGYSAGANGGTVKVVTPPLTLTSTTSPGTSYHSQTITWTATTGGGTPATTQVALFRRRAGTTTWTPAVTAPAWQTSKTLSWTPATTETGTWEISIWVKDGDTPVTQNTYGYATSYNPGTVQIVNPPTLSVTMSPSPVNAGTTITWTASATSSNTASLRYAFFRRPSGTTTWSPSVTAPVWQTSNVYSWTPTSANVGGWDTYVWVKDAYTPATMNTYGYAAGFNTGGLQVVVPFTGLTCSANASAGYAGSTFTWSANAGGGDSATRRYALLRRKVGTSTWVPAQTSPSWQSSNAFSWTTSSTDAGSWEIAIWVKDGNTASNANTYGYALSCNPGTFQVLAPPTVSGTSSPSQSPYGATISWTATGSGGDSGSYRYAIFRRRAGTSTWTPDVSSPSWQTGRTFSWTPTSADVGTWEVFIWIKDAYTPSNMNTYGHAAWYNAGNVEVTTPAPVTVTGTGSPSTSPAGTTISWTATASGGIPGTYQYALFRRRAGTSTWTPDVTAPNWQTSRTMSWTPTANDVGTWEIFVWVKDINTPPTQNGYGQAAWYNAQPVTVY